MKEIEYLKKYYDGDINEAIELLKQGKPVQYIVGNVDFYGLNFKVNENVLIPRFETEELVEKTIEYVGEYFDKDISILDIGTGSGCIAITLNKNLNSKVDAVDISDEALQIARINNENNNTKVNFFKSNIFENVNKKYDLIISNPPYIAYDEEIMDIVKDNEPNIALYADDNGLYFYKDILRNAKKNLKRKSIIAFEIGMEQGEYIKEFAHRYFPKSKILIEKDYNDRDRFVFIINE